jgi:hypothetical protein
MATDERQLLVDKVSVMLKRVPAKVNTGGIETARSFKKWYARASKIIQAPRSTMTQVIGVYGEAADWYK